MRTYRLAEVTDGARLLELCRRSRVKITKAPSVTFVAEEDGVVHAALGLDWSGEFTVAGPLVVSKEARTKRWMILRLAETLEQFLAERGVDRYVLSIACNNKRWTRLVEKAGAVRYAVRDGRNWYIRRVGAYGDSDHAGSAV